MGHLCLKKKYEIHNTDHFQYYPLLHRHSVRPVLFVPVIIEKPNHPNNFNKAFLSTRLSFQFKKTKVGLLDATISIYVSNHIKSNKTNKLGFHK